MTGPSAGWDEAPLMKHPLKFTTTEAHPDVTRLSFKPGPTPTPTTVTPSVPPTPATQLAKTGALTGDVLVLAAVTGTIGAAALRRNALNSRVIVIGGVPVNHRHPASFG